MLLAGNYIASVLLCLQERKQGNPCISLLNFIVPVGDVRLADGVEAVHYGEEAETVEHGAARPTAFRDSTRILDIRESARWGHFLITTPDRDSFPRCKEAKKSNGLVGRFVSRAQRASAHKNLHTPHPNDAAA